MNELELMMKVYEDLEDKQSKYVYRKRLDYILTKDPSHIMAINTRYCKELAVYPDEIIEEFIQSLPKEASVILYGAGLYGGMYIHLWKKLGERPIGYCDADQEKQKGGFKGYVVLPPEDLVKYPDAVLVITIREHAGIADTLEQRGVKRDHIFQMPTGLLESEKQYFDPDIVTYEDEGEVFVDAGCFDLSTSLLLKKRCPIKKVYAFEPDPNNMKKCMQNKALYHFDEVELFPYGTWGRNGVVGFNAKNNVDSFFVEDALDLQQVEVRTIDSIIDDGLPVTYIKMDVEGSEFETLKGAQNTIKRYRPKLAVYIYHKVEDMFELPIYIKQLVPEYRLYLRHYSNMPEETVLYAVI